MKLKYIVHNPAVKCYKLIINKCSYFHKLSGLIYYIIHGLGFYDKGKWNLALLAPLHYLADPDGECVEEGLTKVQ